MECVWCLLLMGHLRDQNRKRLQLSWCGQRLITVDNTTNPKRPAEDIAPWMLISLAIYLKTITQLVLSQILCNE